MTMRTSTTFGLAALPALAAGDNGGANAVTLGVRYSFD